MIRPCLALKDRAKINRRYAAAPRPVHLTSNRPVRLSIPFGELKFPRLMQELSPLIPAKRTVTDTTPV